MGSRSQMETQGDKQGDDAFCDEAESREQRKNREWKERVQKENQERRDKQATTNGTASKRRKIMPSAKKSKPSAVFSIFDKAKMAKTKQVEKVVNAKQNEIDN